MSSKVPSNTTHSLNPYDSMGVAMAGRGKAGTRGMALQPRSEISQLFPLQEGTHPVTPCGGTAAPGSHAKIYPQSVQQIQPSPHRPRGQPQNLTGSCSYQQLPGIPPGHPGSFRCFQLSHRRHPADGGARFPHDPFSCFPKRSCHHFRPVTLQPPLPVPSCSRCLPVILQFWLVQLQFCHCFQCCETFPSSF